MACPTWYGIWENWGDLRHVQVNVSKTKKNMTVAIASLNQDCCRLLSSLSGNQEEKLSSQPTHIRKLHWKMMMVFHVFRLMALTLVCSRSRRCNFKSSSVCFAYIFSVYWAGVPIAWATARAKFGVEDCQCPSCRHGQTTAVYKARNGLEWSAAAGIVLGCCCLRFSCIEKHQIWFLTKILHLEHFELAQVMFEDGPRFQYCRGEQTEPERRKRWSLVLREMLGFC